ncbi:MAG: hypothetical protein CMN30_28145 [Sandaracinus sp.]|nr:hypothetical protein [Sandaracinus sp.]|tara:strand:- start:229 stop:1164 length:936 start_codon:yes stop_codon:yes gene_type:complete
MELAAEAMRLRDEQLRARVVYVDPQIETNAELDAITAKVVAELRELQRVGMRAKTPEDPQQVEIELISSLRTLLEKMVSARREHFLRHKLELIQRQVAKLFFSSEVKGAAETAADRTFQHPEEAFLAVIQKHAPSMRQQLGSFTYAEPAVKAGALERLERIEKMLAADVLARSRPELERLLHVYRDVILVYLMKDFRESLGEFAWEVVRESGAARTGDLSYKIREKQFPRFRAVFEEKFMARLLQGISEPLARALTEDSDYMFRGETLAFASDPRIYAEVCAVMCNTVYGYLHGEGYLDLPVSWQRELYED